MQKPGSSQSTRRNQRPLEAYQQVIKQNEATFSGMLRESYQNVSASKFDPGKFLVPSPNRRPGLQLNTMAGLKRTISEMKGTIDVKNAQIQ